jgi:integrase
VAAGSKRTGRKRGNNEGSIKLRSDGRYEARVTLPDGKRKSFYGKTRQEVQKAMTAALRDVQQGRPIPVGRETLGTYIGRWLADVVAPDLRASTYRSYEQLARVHVVPALGKLQLRDLDPARIRAFLNDKRAAGLSPGSVLRLYALIRQVLNQAHRDGLIAEPPTARMKAPTVPRYEAAMLTPEQARTVLNAFRGDRLEALITVALALGLRQGEALGLRWQDVDLNTGTLTVRYQLQRIKGVPTLVEPKTKGSGRTIALPAPVAEALNEHRVRQLEARLAAGSRWQERGLVFTSTIGTPLDGVKVTRRFQDRLARGGLSRMRFHDLRHSAASLLLAQGVHPRVVMELLGHSDIRLTMNTYSHVIPQLTRDAADKMGAVLFGTS